MRQNLIFLMILFLILGVFASNLNAVCVSTTGNNLIGHELKVISNQSFETNFENWGKVKFISEIIDNRLKFILKNENNQVLYIFPNFLVEGWKFFQIRVVSFKDVNKDGLKDVILIADYATGIGKEGAIPFPICNIYFQEDKRFINLEKLDNEINNSMQNKDISSVLLFLKNKVSYINELLKNETNN